MTTFQNKTFTNQNIVVDGNSYQNCRFVDCVVIYRGGATPTFDDCAFSGLRIQLEEGASSTVKYLTGLYHGGLANTVERVLDKIERGELVPPPVPKAVVPPENIGTNYGRLALIAGVMILVSVLLGLSFWYGLLYQPQNEILRGPEARALTWEFPEALMPALPDELAQLYNEGRDAQFTQINTYQWVSESAGTVRIPIEAAITLLLENQ